MMEWRVTFNHHEVYTGDMAGANTKAQTLRNRHPRPDSVRIISPSGQLYELNDYGEWCEVEEK